MKIANAARKKLKNSWPQAIAAEGIIAAARMLHIIAGLTYTLILRRLDADGVNSAVGVIIPAVIMLLMDWLIVSPLLIGRTMLYWDIINRRPVSCARVFDGWSKFTAALKWRWGRFFRRTVYSIVCLAPAAALFWGMSVLRAAPRSPRTDALLLTGTVGMLLLPLAGLVFCEWLMLRSAAADCVIACGSLTVRKPFSRSRKAMNGNVTGLAWMCAGFAGWGILSLFIIPLIYTVPLYHTSRLMAVRRCLLEYNPAGREVLGESRSKKVPAGKLKSNENLM